MFPQTFEKGALIYSQGDPSQGWYLIVSGAVRIYRSSARGKEQTLQRLAAGHSFADVSAFDGGRRIGSAQAVERTTVLVLPGRELHELARRDPAVALGILDAWSSRLRELSDLAARLSRQQVVSRVAGVVLQVTGNGESGLLPKKAILASTVGTAREVATRALKQLESDGLVELGPRRKIAVRDRKALKKVAGDTPFPVSVVPQPAAKRKKKQDSGKSG